MSQIPLNFRKKLRYDPKNFIWHQGVSSIYDYLESAPSSMAFISGQSRSGKTHLGISAADIFLSRGLYPQIISEIQNSNNKFSAKDIVIVDNVGQYFSTLEDSGHFVSFCEDLKKSEAGLILLSDQPFNQWEVDQHVLSRLKSMSIFQIMEPALEDLSGLIESLARQRSIALSKFHCDYLSDRLSRSIPEIEEYIERLHYFMLNSSETMSRTVLSRVL